MNTEGGASLTTERRGKWNAKTDLFVLKSVAMTAHRRFGHSRGDGSSRGRLSRLRVEREAAV